MRSARVCTDRVFAPRGRAMGRRARPQAQFALHRAQGANHHARLSPARSRAGRRIAVHVLAARGVAAPRRAGQGVPAQAKVPSSSASAAGAPPAPVRPRPHHGDGTSGSACCDRRNARPWSSAAINFGRSAAATNRHPSAWRRARHFGTDRAVESERLVHSRRSRRPRPCPRDGENAPEGKRAVAAACNAMPSVCATVVPLKLPRGARVARSNRWKMLSGES